jgi:hypothetical protein
MLEYGKRCQKMGNAEKRKETKEREEKSREKKRKE